MREEYLLPLGMSVNALAQALRVPATRLHEIVKERRSISADTALRLARYFGGDAQSWLNLQAEYDLKTTEVTLRKRIDEEVRPRGRHDLSASLLHSRCGGVKKQNGRQSASRSGTDAEVRIPAS